VFSLSNKRKASLFMVPPKSVTIRYFLEVDMIGKRGSGFMKRQKGQLKLDNSVLEEFMIYLVDNGIIN